MEYAKLRNTDIEISKLCIIRKYLPEERVEQ